MSTTQASYTFGCATSEPAIDGDFDDCTGLGVGLSVEKLVAGPAPTSPFRATWQGGWNSDALFVHVRVPDASLRAVDEAFPDQWWRGDGVSFEFGPDNRGLLTAARPRTGQDVHLMIGLTASGAGASANPAAQGNFPPGGRRTHVTAVRAITTTGYELKARIPWSALGLTEPPERGFPATWQRLVLGDAAS